jgi:polyhydroxyalkanoic acid synthase PhaR subunit
LQFATRWYNATSGPFSDFVGDVIEREEFLEPSSQFLQSYASFYKVFKRNSEEYLKSLQLPVRSDISRVAGLVINLEDKVDRIEEVLEDFEYTPAKPATADSIEALEERIGGIERARGAAQAGREAERHRRIRADAGRAARRGRGQARPAARRA